MSAETLLFARVTSGPSHSVRRIAPSCSAGDHCCHGGACLLRSVSGPSGPSARVTVQR